jgi:hypothetical protein
MVHYSTIASLVVILIILGIVFLFLYFHGVKQQLEKEERENCFLNISKICMECQLPPNPKGLKECNNTLPKDSKCRELLNEKGDYISDCSKYMGK